MVAGVSNSLSTLFAQNSKSAKSGVQGSDGSQNVGETSGQKDRVSLIKERIQNGQYEIDLQATAKKIVEDFS